MRRSEQKEQPSEDKLRERREREPERERGIHNIT